MQLFYLPGTNLFKSFEEGNYYLTLPKEESLHAARVLRLKPGDHISVTDGTGNTALAVIEDPNPKSCEIRMVSIDQSAGKGYNLHIAVAPTKNAARIEWFLEKATEFGLQEITPVYCDHSERQKIRTERMEKVVIAAMKQSLSSFLPKINPPVDLSQLIKSNAGRENTFIAWVDEVQRPHLKDVCLPGKDALVLIGPEGDFSPAEIRLALDNGFQPVSLGKARLRTETAALASCFIVNLLNEPLV
ncbi:MAG: 16S rRNA (uracil(1498)-N(3))-methyltransferase [Bacteroidota bacterium]